MAQFFKIYLWQVISLVTGFATMFVVTPYLASNQNYFGIYTFVVSLNLFLAYADFGFLNAGAKFASEAFAKDDRRGEIKMLGFVFFILISVFLIFGLVSTFFYINPHFLLKGLNSDTDIRLAKDLFLVFIVSLPVLAAQRAIQMIFNIRLNDYIFQRVYSLLNLLKIVSVFLFFQNGEYHIVLYYAFTQLISLISVVIGCVLAKKQFNYDFLELVRALKFEKEIYHKTKGLAYNSLYVTVSWILYYELDSLLIGKFVGLKEVAVFNICISVMTLARSLYSILYNPFSAKFNHYIGRNQYQSLSDAFEKILIIGLPFSVIPTAILIFTMKNFILVWVGVDYSNAIPIIAVMFASYFFTFVSNPTSIAMVALQKIKKLYVISTIIPIIYWIGILLTFNNFGLLSFGIFKFVAFFISACFYIVFAKDMFDINWRLFLTKNVLPAFMVILVCYYINTILEVFLPVVKGKVEFLEYAVIIFSYFLFCMSLYYFLSQPFRCLSKELVREVFRKGK